MSSTHEDGMGGRITILEHGNHIAPMRFRMTLPRGLAPPAPECHPSQTEDFKVLHGTLDLGVIDGKHIVLHAGDTFHLPAGVYHLPRNPGETDMEFEAVLTPGLESGDMFMDLYAVLREHRGLGRIARLSMVFRRYSEAIHFKAPVRVGMAVVAATARLFGVRPAAAHAAPLAPAKEARRP